MTRVIKIGLFTLLLIAAGCGGRQEPVRISSDEIDAPRPGATPIEVLENIALAHGSRDIDLYREQFDPRFQMHLASGEDSWNDETRTHLEKEIETTAAIFAASRWIHYATTCDGALPSDVEGFPASEGYQKVVARDFDVSFWLAGTEDTISVKDDSVLFVFAPDPADEGGKWRVICQKLFSGGEGCAVEPIEE